METNLCDATLIPVGFWSLQAGKVRFLLGATRWAVNKRRIQCILSSAAHILLLSSPWSIPCNCSIMQCRPHQQCINLHVIQKRANSFNNRTHMQVFWKCFIACRMLCIFHDILLAFKMKGHEEQWPGRGHKLCTAPHHNMMEWTGWTAGIWLSAAASSPLAGISMQSGRISLRNAGAIGCKCSLSASCLADLDWRGLESKAMMTLLQHLRSRLAAR